MPAEPAYYRQRLAVIAQAINRTSDEKELRLLRNGYMPDPLITDWEEQDNSPLSFAELCQWDTWFAMHPEKVCGQTVTTTSRSFPLKTKGTKEDVTRTIMKAIDMDQRIREARTTLSKLKF